MTKARDLANGGFGLVLIKPSTVVNGTDNGKGTISFSAQSTVSLNGVFNSTYDNYRIVFGNLNGSGALSDVGFRLRKSGTDNTSNIYYRQYLDGSSTTASIGRVQSTSWVVFAVRDQGPFQSYLELTNPNTANVRTGGITNQAYGSVSTPSVTISSYTHDLAASADFDGFTIFPASGTMSGTVSVYGYNK